MQYALLITIVLFFAGLLLRKVFKNLCALCFAVAGTWILLLFSDALGWISVDVLILAIYMGGSAVGLMYFLSSKLPEKYHLFKLPFILTLFGLIYLFLGGTRDNYALELLLLWILFVIIFVLKVSPTLQKIGREIIKCCKNW